MSARFLTLARLPMLAFLALLVYLAQSGSALADQLDLVWNENPLPIALQVDVEHRIDFPDTIAALDVPDQVRDSANIVLSPKGVLLVTANTAFTDARLFATSVTGSVYIIDLTASTNQASPNHVSIVDPALDALQERAERERKQAIPAFLTGEASPHPPTLNYVEISRFALAHHIGPKRLVPALPNASTVEVINKPITRFVRLNDAIQVTPLKQWKVGSLYVTTLGVKNTGSNTYQFDARGLRGQFVFVATASLALEPSPLQRDTIWSVISRTPFSVAIGEAHR